MRITKKLTQVIIGGFAVTMLGGCAGLLNPYESEFLCAEQTTDPGKCVTITAAYKESLKQENTPSDYDTPAYAQMNSRVQADPDFDTCPDCDKSTKLKKTGQPDKPASIQGGATTITSLEPGMTVSALGTTISQQKIMSEYEKALLKRYTDILKKPVTPMMTPGRQMRVLMLPYQGDNNELYAMRYVYLMVEQPSWILGNYLIQQEER